MPPLAAGSAGAVEAGASDFGAALSRDRLRLRFGEGEREDLRLGEAERLRDRL